MMPAGGELDGSPPSRDCLKRSLPAWRTAFQAQASSRVIGRPLRARVTSVRVQLGMRVVRPRDGRHHPLVNTLTQATAHASNTQALLGMGSEVAVAASHPAWRVFLRFRALRSPQLKKTEAV